MYVMKKMILLILIVSSQFSYSQSNRDVKKELSKVIDLWAKTEIMGVNHLYCVDTVSFGDITSCLVMKKDSVTENLKYNIGPEKYQLGLDSYETLCEIVGENLSQKINIQAATSKNDDLGLTLLSDMSGAIIKVTFSYRSFLRIPIPLLENIEEEIKMKCRVLIDHQSPALKNANYVDYSTTVFLREVCN